MKFSKFFGKIRTYLLNHSYTENNAFTLVELLVTIAIIGVLAALLAGSVTYGRERAKVAKCSNNFRQLGIAAIIYSSDGNHGLFPSPLLKTASSGLTNYGSIEPTFVDFAMITNLNSLGVVPEMYFCPTRRRWRDADEFYRAETGRDIQTGSDLVNYYHLQGASMAFLDMFWWVPRPLEGLGDAKFPDPVFLETRTSQPWPLKADDPSSAIQPIASDWLLGGWNNELRKVTSASGGHTFKSKIVSNNALFADGHVETRPFATVTWQMLNNRKDTAYLY